MSFKIQEYYLEHKSIFDEKFKIVSENFDADAIHKMRTTTKRLRGLFQLIQYLSKNKFKSKKQLKKIRNLFKYVGKIREIQIEQLLVYELEERLNLNFSEYREYLLVREHKEISMFIKTLPKFTIKDEVLDNEYIMDTIKNLDPEIAEKRAKKFIKSKAKTLRKLNSKAISNNRIHQNRTILKQIYYLYDILTDITKTQIIFNIEKVRMREIEQLIGSWHDKVNSFHFLNAFFKTKIGEKTPKYKKLKTQITEDREIKKREIVEILRTEVIC